MYFQYARYLVFVDDVQRGTACEDIKDAFRENVMDSRIIVTTSVPSIPWDCSSGSYVYTMQGLDKENSRTLFQKMFLRKAGYSAQEHYSMVCNDVDIIIDKCDGLPIALISAANVLHGKGRYPKTGDFKQVNQELGNILVCNESDFERYKKKNGNDTASVDLRRAFVEPYENLLNNGEKDCLLYLSIFPCGHQINSKSLVRKLIAEGLGPGDPHIMEDSELVVGDARECLRMLMDQHMIEPVPIRSNCNAAKTCQVHSIMLQFTIKKAVSRNLVSLIQKDKSLHNRAGHVRRLTIQSSSGCSKHPERMDLSVLRSLAIFESEIVNFKECKLVRVLDLEGCRGLTPLDLDKICGLLFLKYLSLKKTNIQELPGNVKNLLCLETLDTRDTVVIKLPVEVIMLPRLAYLFGQFELTNVHPRNKKISKFFSEKKSQLHTLGGISVNGIEGLEIVVLVIQHATKLKKVKLWYRSSQSSTGPVNTFTQTAGGTPEPTHCDRRRKLSAGPPADPNSNTQDPAAASSTPVANGTRQPIPCDSSRGLFKHKWNLVRLFSKGKSSAEPSTYPSSNTPDPAPASPPPRHPSAGPSTHSNSNTPNPVPAKSTPLASDTPLLIHCVSKLTETLKKHPMITLESLSIDFNGVSNTFLDFLQMNGTISSIKLVQGQKSLPSPLELGKVSNLKKLHLFSTGLKSSELAALQHLKCLQYLKLAEDGHGLWDSVFHVQVGGFISLIWLCFEASNSLHPPLKIDEGVKTPLASLVLLCEESEYPLTATPVPIGPQMETEQGHVVRDISHLPNLNEVILHKNASDSIVMAWKEEAKKHINRPYVEKQQV
jgi:hypothetical protein